MKKVKGLTLIELLITLVMLAVVGLGIFSFDLFARSQTISADRRTSVQNEASIVLDHMIKHVSGIIGSLSEPAFYAYTDNRGIYFRTDSNHNGIVDGSDQWDAYRHINDTIVYFSNVASSGAIPSVGEVISRRIVLTDDPINGDPATWGLVIDHPVANQFNITVRARWNPQQAANPNNPQVELTAVALSPSISTN